MSRDLVLIVVAMFTWGLGEGLFLYFQPLYLQQMGADPIHIGAILSGYSLAMTVSNIPAGYLADRLGRRAMMLAAWLIGLAATWIMALAGSLPVFISGLLLYGLTLFVLPPLNSYVTAARGRWSVGRAITLVSASYNLGAVIGPWLGGRIADQAGLRQTYAIAGWIFVVSTVVIFFIRPQPVEAPVAGQAGRSSLLPRRYAIYLVAVFLAVFAMYLPQPLSPNFLRNQRQLGLEEIGRLFSTTSVGVVALNLILGQLPARTGFLIAQAAVGSFALLLWRGASLAWYSLAFFLLGGYKTARSLATAQVREFVQPGRMGLTFGLSETVGASATILAPLLAGYLYSRRPSWMYLLSAGFILVSLLASARFSPQPGQAEAPGAPAELEAADLEQP